MEKSNKRKENGRQKWFKKEKEREERIKEKNMTRERKKTEERDDGKQKRMEERRQGRGYNRKKCDEKGKENEEIIRYDLTANTGRRKDGKREDRKRGMK